MEGDYHVGQILDALNGLGVDDNTIVIFASDNGPWGEVVREFGNHGTPDMGSSGPFRGELGEVSEGSIRSGVSISPTFIQPASGCSGIGVNGFYLQQTTGDSGSGARLGSFEEMTTGLGQTSFAAELKWLPQIGTVNTLQGNYIWFKVAVQF
jgi:Sulfatase